MNYRREIDGLRALAILPVVFFHAGFLGFSGGFVGVDVFFVISGYLISSNIMVDLTQNRFSLLNFYERRARRILPALLFMLAVSFVFALVWASPYIVQEIAQSLVAATLFASNIFFWLDISYFDSGSALKPFFHTWSLSVEEQFYLAFPLVLLCVWRLKRSWLIPLVSMAIIISLGLAEWASYNKPNANFYLLPTRGWELLLGVLVACLDGTSPASRRSRGGGSAAGLGVGMIVFAVVIFDEHYRHPSLFTLIPVLGAALVIRYGQNDGVTHRILSSRVLVGFGLISYSLYLWHQPVLALARGISDIELTTWHYVLLVLGSMLLAVFSWKYVEQPFRDTRRVSPRLVWSWAGGGSLFVIGLAVVGATVSTARLSAGVDEFARYDDYSASKLYREGYCFLLPDEGSEDFSRECLTLLGEESFPVFLWGDSHAAALYHGIASHATTSQFTASSCPPILGLKHPKRPFCHSINDFVISEIERSKSPVVLLAASWVLGEYDGALFKQTLDRLRLTRTRVVVLGPLPYWKPTLPRYLRRKYTELDNVPQSAVVPAMADLRHMERRLTEVANQSGVEYLSLLKLGCPKSKCMVSEEIDAGKKLYVFDHAHLTEAGSLYYGEKIIESLKNNQSYMPLNHDRPDR